MSDQSRARVTIVGGGLAGLAAAVALAESKSVDVELLEARRALGGRATSFYDADSGELFDHCQHVSMGCCTNLADFCRRTGSTDLFRYDREVRFFTLDGRCYALAASRWLPPPLHLLPSLWGLKYLSAGERLGIMRAMVRLARTPPAKLPADEPFADWLTRHGQSERAQRDFWGVVLVSALSESLDRISVPYARQVFVGGFMAARQAGEVAVPRVSLHTLYGERLQEHFARRGVRLELASAVRRVHCDDNRATQVELADGSRREVDRLIVALTWRRTAELFDAETIGRVSELQGAAQIESAPITGVHLWFDRPFTDLPHAVIVGGTSQWLFNRGQWTKDAEHDRLHYYQVVISASRHVTGLDRDELARHIHDELAAIWPAAGDAKLRRWRMITEREAVFSVRPGIDELRPSQQTALANLFLAGDWTRTGWPSTMEGAVRSGYLAAECVLRSLGREQPVVVADLRRSMLTWLVCGSE